MTLAFGGSWPSWQLSGRDDAKCLDSNATEMRPAINSLAELPAGAYIRHSGRLQPKCLHP
jgi:hypothetical protein